MVAPKEERKARREIALFLQEEWGQYHARILYLEKQRRTGERRGRELDAEIRRAYELRQICDDCLSKLGTLSLYALLKARDLMMKAKGSNL